MADENILEKLAHRLATELVPIVKAQREYLTHPTPVGYKKLTSGEIDEMLADPTGGGRMALISSMGYTEFMNLMNRKNKVI